MRTELNRHKLFSRRAFVLGGGKLILSGALISRMYYLQILKSSEFQTLSDNNRIKLVLTAPERGHILDRLGVPLAFNSENYQVFLNKGSFKKQPKTTYYDILCPILNKPPEVLDAIIAQTKKEDDAYLLAEHLTWEQLSGLEVRKPELPGMFVEIGRVRVYPYGDITSHSIGYIGAVAESDKEHAALKRLPDLKIGKDGLEKIFDDSLRGTPGVKQQEVNSVGATIRENNAKLSLRGEDLNSSLDAELLEFSYKRLAEERSASAAVMNIHTGEVLVLASAPGYDPNKFSKGILSKDWNALLKDPLTPLLNKTIAGQYPPGSTFKMLTGLTGLRTGAVTPDTHFHCPGHFNLGSRRFHCWRREGHGSMNIITAIERSCDVYFYNVGLRVGIDAIAETCHQFGLGKRTGIEMPNEKGGLIPSTEWKKKQGNIPWQKGDTVNASIGQGYVLATPLQLATMSARFATGREVKPTLLKHRGDTPPAWNEININPAHLQLIREGMEHVTTNPNGTAYWKRIMNDAFAMAGKTGTSQVKALSKLKSNKQELLPWEDRHHGLFVAYAPIHAPKYAAAIVVEHGGSGSGAAAPIARDILQKLQELELERASKNTPAPELPAPETAQPPEPVT